MHTRRSETALVPVPTRSSLSRAVAGQTRLMGFVGLATWEVLRHRLAPSREDIGFVAAWIIVLAAAGFGAFNEVVEYVLTLTLSATNVGGYDNTARDLAANMAGGVLMATWTARRLRRSP